MNMIAEDSGHHYHKQNEQDNKNIAKDEEN